MVNTEGSFHRVVPRAGDAANRFYLDDYTVADAFVAYSMPINGDF